MDIKDKNIRLLLVKIENGHLDKLVFHKIDTNMTGGMVMERIDNLRNLDFEQMKSVDVRTVEREDLTDISKIQINKNLPKDERFADFGGQVKNPYCYRCGKVVVKVSFADTGITLEERLEHYLGSLSG